MTESTINLYKILLKFKGFRTYNIQFEDTNLEDKVKYRIVANSRSQIFREQRNPIIAYKDLFAVQLTTKINVNNIKEIVKKVLQNKGYHAEVTVVEKEINSPDENPSIFQELVERFSIIEVNSFLRKVGFKTFLRGKRIVIPLKHLVENASLTMGDYRAERYVTLKIISNKNDALSPFLQIDVYSSIEGTTTIWQQLKHWLNKRKKDLSDLRSDINLQEEANLEFKSDNPRLTTTYQRELSTGEKKKDIYYFLSFDFHNTPETRKIRYNDKEISVSEYYLKRYGIELSEKDQLIINVKRATRGRGRSGSFEPIPIPSNLVVECPDTKVLERYDFSYTYSKFALLSPNERMKNINRIASILHANNIISRELIASYHPIATPILFDGKNRFSFYEGGRYSGRCLRYPNLKKLKILFFGRYKSWFDKNRGREIINHLKNELNSLLIETSKESGKQYEKTHYDILFEPNMENWKRRFDNILTDSETFDAYLIITSPPNQSFYNYVKQKYTIRKQIPTQFLYFSTLKKLYKKGHLIGLVKSILKQIIVKCGGVPYLLSNNSNLHLVYVGVDRSRDVFGDQPSLSAGVAAVAPNGEYLGADTTRLDRYADDFIDISSILPNIIYKIKQKRNNTKVLVLLRDGGKYSISDHEINTAKQIVKNANLDLIFLSANKSSGFRAFLKKAGSFEGFSRPVIFYELPNDPDDFLIFSTLPKQGTQTPILYSILENTTTYSNEEIKTLLSADLAGLCSLVWEAMSPTNLPLPLHYADKLAGFCKNVEHPWAPEIDTPLFI